MINVNEVKQGTELLTLKDQKTKYLSGGEYNTYLKLALTDIVNMLRDNFESGKVSSDNLSDLKKFVTYNVDPETGRLAKPSDFLFMDTFFKNSFFKNKDGEEFSTQTEVEYITDAELPSKLDSLLSPVTKQRPIVVEYDTYFQFYPTNIGLVKATYIRQPLIPFWNWTVSSNVQVYAATGGSQTNPNAGVTAGNSTQIELPPQIKNEFIKKVCEYIAISVRQPDLIQGVKTV